RPSFLTASGFALALRHDTCARRCRHAGVRMRFAVTAAHRSEQPSAPLGTGFANGRRVGGAAQLAHLEGAVLVGSTRVTKHAAARGARLVDTRPDAIGARARATLRLLHEPLHTLHTRDGRAHEHTARTGARRAPVVHRLTVVTANDWAVYLRAPPTCRRTLARVARFDFRLAELALRLGLGTITLRARPEAARALTAVAAVVRTRAFLALGASAV